MHSDADHHYTMLGVDPTSSADAIHVAFRRRAKQLHPDSPSGDATAFIQLKRAFDTLSDPLARAKYDRVCQAPPAPPPPEPHQWTPPPPPSRPRTRAQHFAPRPIPTRPIPTRRGVGIARYVIAFLIMAALSLGGVQAMISLTQAPPSIRTRDAQTVTTPSASAPAAESTAAPGSTKSGFWDATPPAPRKN